MQKLEIYTKSWCPYCVAAKAFLKNQDVSFIEYDVEQTHELVAEMRARSKRTSVPQIFIGDHHIGGFDDLSAASRSGALQELLVQKLELQTNAG